MSSLLMIIITIFFISFTVTTVAAFDSYNTDFEDFSLGHRVPQVNGEPLIDDPSTLYNWRGDGITGLGGQEDYDADIVDVGSPHAKVFRISNPSSAATGNYDTTHPSTPQTDLAGESATGASYNQFNFSYEFKAASTTMQDGLEVRTTAFKAGSASRHALIMFTDNATAGFSVGYYDYYQDSFRYTTLATDLSRSDWHTLSVTMSFFNGEDNDEVIITIDGTSFYLTTWEGYYIDAGPPQPDYAGVDSVIFRIPNGGGPEGDGVYFDNFNCEVGSIPTCDSDVDINPGFESDADCSAGARWRNFRVPHPGWDIAVGDNIGDAASSGIDWSHAELTGNYYFIPEGPNTFTFTYDQSTGDQIIDAQVNGGSTSITHNNGDLGLLNYLQIDVVARDGHHVEFNNVLLTIGSTDYHLCDFEAEDSWNTWYIDSLDLTNGFTITGEALLFGQGSSDELSKISVSAGYLHPCCPDVWVDDDADSSWYDHCHVHTMQEAIDHVCEYGTVHVLEGTYYPTSTITVNKPVTILGPQATVDPRPYYGSTRTAGDDTSEAIIDGNGILDTIIYIASDEVIINGLEICQGTGDLVYSNSPAISDVIVEYCIIHDSSGDEGIQLKHCTLSGIYRNYIFDIDQDGANFGYSSFCDISENEITGSDSENAGIYVYSSTNILIEKNVIHETTAANGIELYTNIGDIAIVNNLVVDNEWMIKSRHHEYSGNAILGYKYTETGNTVTIAHNTLSNNKVSESSTYHANEIGYGNGIGINTVIDYSGLYYDGFLDIQNNIISHNGLSTYGYGLITKEYYGCVGPTPAHCTISYNDVYNNGAGSCQGTFCPIETTTNIFADPLFVNLGTDYHLQSSSPCRDTGADLGIPDDINNTLRDDHPDMGAYEYVITCADEIWVDDDADSSWYDFTHVLTVQTGIDHVCPNGTVYVHPGHYNEQITITKPLTLISTNGAGVTTIQKTANSVITVHANEVIIDGFTLIGDNTFESQHKGIYIPGSHSNIEIKNCDITASAPIWAHWTSSSHTNILIENNVLHHGDWGLVLFNVDDSTISNNEFFSFSDLGIQLTTWGSRPLPTNNIIRNNIFDEIVYHDILLQAQQTLVEYNIITGGGDFGIGIANQLQGYTDIFSVPNNEIHCNKISNHQKQGLATGYHTGIKPGVFQVTNIPETVSATCNWWGDCSGPFNTTWNPTGYGDNVSGSCIADPWIGKITGVDAGGPYQMNTNGEVHFDGSYDTPYSCCGGSYVIEWDFGDGTTSNLENPVHVYSSESGGFTATFTVTTMTTIGSETITCEKTDASQVSIDDTDPPLVQIVTPKDGDNVNGMVTVKWYAIDDDYPGGQGLPISLYYKNGAWRLISDDLTNNIDDEHGSYEWDTNGFADGTYELMVQVMDSNGNVASDKVTIHVGNGNSEIMVSDVFIEDETIGSNHYVKDGDTVIISAGITGNSDDLTADDIRADLTGFGLDSQTPAESFDGFTATWTLENVVCHPSNGQISVTVTLLDTSKTAVINSDNTVPEITITNPFGLYVFNHRVLPMKTLIAFGSIDILVSASDNNYVDHVDYYLDGVLVGTENEAPFDWQCDLKSFGGHHNVEAIVFDGAGNQNTVSQEITLFNLFGQDW